MNIGSFMNDSIQNIASTVLRASSQNFSELRFITKLIPALRKSAKTRDVYEKNGTHIPPFLIASVASQCNLHCAGCYARASGECHDGDDVSDELTAAEWDAVFAQASELGISFILLAGGEPLLRRDVVDKAIQHSDIVFPIFTNGTLIDEEYAELFHLHRNLIPILSLEGNDEVTDARRGKGVSENLHSTMNALKSKGILYGTSITVTSENMEWVTSTDFVSDLQQKGCGIVFFVEYVPAEKGSENLVPSEAQREYQEQQIKLLQKQQKNMALIAFPGDEKLLGGCLAAGRGFFHINPTGGAEPCPFAPFSDTNLKNSSLLEALASPLFGKLKEQELLAIPHAGGCALFDKKDVINELINS